MSINHLASPVYDGMHNRLRNYINNGYYPINDPAMEGHSLPSKGNPCVSDVATRLPHSIRLNPVSMLSVRGTPAGVCDKNGKALSIK
jgi:hypothetical protein